MEGELAVGELQLAATDPGLLALATALAGVSPKTLADIYTCYTLASSGAGLKVTGAVTTSGTATVSGTVAVSTLPDAANAVLTAVKDQLTDYPQREKHININRQRSKRFQYRRTHRRQSCSQQVRRAQK